MRLSAQRPELDRMSLAQLPARRDVHADARPERARLRRGLACGRCTHRCRWMRPSRAREPSDPIWRGLALPQLEPDQLQSVGDVVEGVLEKLIERPEGRGGRVAKEAPQLGHEALDAGALGGGRTAEPVGEVDDAKARVPRLVAQHEPEDVAHQRIGAFGLETLEDADGDALEEDLHADDLLTVVVGIEEAIDQLFEGPVDRRLDAEPLEVATEHFHVARLVDDLTSEA